MFMKKLTENNEAVKVGVKRLYIIPEKNCTYNIIDKKEDSFFIIFLPQIENTNPSRKHIINRPIIPKSA